MSVNERFIEVCNNLVDHRIANSLVEIAKSLGKSPQYFTDLKKNKSRISQDIVDQAVKLYPINKNYVLFGDIEVGEEEHNILREDRGDYDVVRIPRRAWNVIEKQADSLASKDEQVKTLINLIQDQINDNRRIIARLEHNARDPAPEKKANAG